MSESKTTTVSRYARKQQGTKFSRRIVRERNLPPHEFGKHSRYLSSNKKTGAALNLPLSCCRPSARCAETCYAMEGFIAASHVIRHSFAVDEMLCTGEGLEKLIRECQRQSDVRLNGIGDLTLNHLPQIFRLVCACPKTIFWGFTRKREIAEATNGIYDNLSLVLSWDATHPSEHVEGYKGPMAYGPVQAGEQVPDDDRIIVGFPEHHQSHPDKKIELHEKDCPATRIPAFREYLKTNACQRCGRCLHPHNASIDTTRFYER